MITVTQSISGKYFSANVPDVVFAITGERARVVMIVDGESVFDENLYPVDGVIAFSDLPVMLTAYAKRLLVFALGIEIEEYDENSAKLASTQMSAEVVFSRADVSTTCEDFCNTHFLSLMMGTRTTAIGRHEYLHYVGTAQAEVRADYDDGTYKMFEVAAVAGNSKYTTIDVSPSNFAQANKELLSYIVTAGSCSQQYQIDLDNPDCAPILLFVNSFGVDEILYCTGTHKIAPTYTRDSMRVGGVLKNYHIEETRALSADTGVLSYEEALWAEDIFRSESIHIVDFLDGELNVGKEVLITDAKGERTNEADELPRLTFTYQYAQRNHNVLDLRRAGRIFDNTFDKTFN